LVRPHKRELETTFEKNGRPLDRKLNPDKVFTTPTGRKLALPGRSLLLVRNVGIHMYTDAVTTKNGEEIPEGFLDATITALPPSMISRERENTATAKRGAFISSNRSSMDRRKSRPPLSYSNGSRARSD